MKSTSIVLLAALALTACTDYQPLQANCFDAPSVSRSSNTLNFLPSSGGRLSNSTAPVAGCSFVTLGEPTNGDMQ